MILIILTSLLFIILLGATSYVIFALNKKVDALKHELRESVFVLIINQLRLEKGTKMSRDKILEIGFKIARYIKMKYNINAKDYAELVKELEKSKIEEDLKSTLVEFFNIIAEVQFSENDLDAVKKLMIKNDLVKILRRMEQPLDMLK